MSKAGEIFAGLTSAVVTAAALGGAVAYVYFYPLDYKQKTEKITEKPQTQEVISKSEEEVQTDSSNPEDTSEQQIGVITNESGSMIIHRDRSNTKISIDKTKVFRSRKAQAEQTPIEQKKEKPLSELKTLGAILDAKNKVLRISAPCPTEDFKIQRTLGVTPEYWRNNAQKIQFKGDKEPRNLLYNQNNGSALFAGDKVGNNYTPTLTVYWI